MSDDRDRVAARLPYGKTMEFVTVWMDPFDVESCCQRDNLVAHDSKLSRWALGDGYDKMVRCRTCGRFWVVDGRDGRVWSRRLRR